MLSCLFIAALWSPEWIELTSWLSFVMSNCVFVSFPCGILGQVWYLIVSIPDLCRLSYFYVSECCEASIKAACWWGRGLTFWWTTESSRTQKGSSTCLSFSKSKANIYHWNLKSPKQFEPWHVIFNNVVFWQVKTQMNLCSLLLTFNAPMATKVVCFSHLLNCLRSLYGKHCGPRSDCSYRFWVHAVCFYI